ncbi:MAG: hypothetical protein ORN21_02010 [Methylophilaceae bacterium]|nr:hypothetical protein [Methylophilaceae bacterium]
MRVQQQKFVVAMVRPHAKTKRKLISHTWQVETSNHQREALYYSLKHGCWSISA